MWRKSPTLPHTVDTSKRKFSDAYLAGIDVNTNDSRGPSGFAAHESGQSDGTQAPHSARGTWLHLRRIQGSSVASTDTAAQQTDLKGKI